MMKKITKAIVGLMIMPFCIKSFKPKKVFKNKRVAIVGPAASALEQENGKYIDDFDYVIRINKAIVNWKPENEKFLGTKTDILFHNFYENSDRGGGGQLNIKLFKSHRVKFLIQPRNNKEGYQIMFNYFKKYISAIRVYTFPLSYYNQLDNLFNKLKPTMGFCALYALLTSPCNEIFITGFTFFKTPYAKGYRDQLIDLKSNELHIKEQGQHNPEVEYELFKDLISKNCNTKVNVDEKLYEILNLDSFDLNPLVNVRI